MDYIVAHMKKIPKKAKSKPKEIKSFTVDGDVYSCLVERLKETDGSSFNISSLINDYLGYLNYWLNSILDYYEKNDISINRGWAINEFFKEYANQPPRIIEIEADSDFRRWHKESVQRDAHTIYGKYQDEKRKLMDGFDRKIKLGSCIQCKFWHDGFCNIKKTGTSTFERCERFIVKEGIELMDLNVLEKISHKSKTGKITEKKKGTKKEKA